MGVTCLYTFGKCNDRETGFVSFLAKPVSSAKDRKLSAEVLAIESTIKKSGATGKTLLERSTSHKRRELDISHISTCKGGADTPRLIRSCDMTLEPSIMVQDSSEHEAAVKLQKVYKGFRTRRKLADCAVLVEQSWWKLLDYVELKQSSISFFDVEKHETAISRWSRARTRAAKVGKGLSKNSKAQKLALQHWLEAIDPRHRYGHNLHFYYAKWLQSQSREPFFFWLDLGEGKDINLVEKCSRSKLHNQCIKYLGPMERKAYEIDLENGKFFNKQSGEILDTTGVSKVSKWIFVLSTSRTLYVGRKQKGTFQHSSFLAGGATLAAGQLVVENGTLRAVWPHSGHYRPTEENFKDFISFLREHNVDLTNVQMAPADVEQVSYHRQNSNLEMRISSSVAKLTKAETCSNVDQTDVEGLDKVKINLVGKEANAHVLEIPTPKKQIVLGRKLTHLEIPTRDELLQKLQSEDLVPVSCENNFSFPRLFDGYESLDEEEEEHETSKQSLSHDGNMKGSHIKALQEDIKDRENPRKDYPSELQNHALEKFNLSPRSATVTNLHSNFTGENRFRPKPLVTIRHATSSPPGTMLFSQKNLPHSSTPSSPLWRASSVEITSFS